MKSLRVMLQTAKPLALVASPAAWKAAPVSAAQALLPIVVRSHARLTEPDQYRGCRLVAMLNKFGQSVKAEHFRSIRCPGQVLSPAPLRTAGRRASKHRAAGFPGMRTGLRSGQRTDGTDGQQMADQHLPTCADDIALPIAASTTRVLEMSAHVAGTLHRECVKTGMDPNYGPGKTELLVAFHGEEHAGKALVTTVAEHFF